MVEQECQRTADAVGEQRNLAESWTWKSTTRSDLWRPYTRRDRHRHGYTTGGERLDWALQQSNIATTQTYVAAMTSHSCYWESDDAVVFMLGKLGGGRLEKPA